METRVIKLIHNNLYAVVEEVKASKWGGVGEARTYLIETDKLNIDLSEYEETELN